MRSIFLIGCFLLAAVPARAEEGPTDDQLLAWERSLGSVGAQDEARAAARRGLASARPVERALAIVRRMMGAASPYARVAGARVAALLRTDARPLAPDLLEGLRDEAPTVRAAAADATGQIGFEGEARESVILALAGLLEDRHGPVRAAALAGLVRVGAITREPVLARVLDPEAEHDVLTALVHDRADRTTILEALLRAPSRGLRRAVLVRMRPTRKDVVPAARRAAWLPLVAERIREDASGVVRLAALLALPRTDPDQPSPAMEAGVAAAVLPALEDGDPVVRGHAYNLADARRLAAHAAIRDVLLEDLGSTDPRLRGAAAWMLRAASANAPGLDARLATLTAVDPEQSVREAAAAARLDRGAFDEVLAEHLVGFVRSLAEGPGLPQPYPEPERSALGYGWGRKLDDGLPAFQPRPAWVTAQVARVGPAIVPRFATALADAPESQRLTWIHALGHAGPEGLEVLQARRAALSTFERLVLDVMRVHGGARTAALVAAMMQALRAVDTASDDAYDAVDSTHRRALLAEDALVLLGAEAVPALVAHLRTAPIAEDGHWPRSAQLAEHTLRRIGAPALPAVREAASGKDAGHRFQDLLRDLAR